jgi:hypothetical protein
VARRYVEDPSSFYVIGRLWIVMFTILTIPLVYLVGRRIMSPVVGLVAAGTWTVLPLVLDYGRLVRSDSAATCLGLLAFLACLRAIDAPSWRRFALAGAAIGLAVSTRYFMVTLLVVLAGAWWYARRDGHALAARGAAAEGPARSGHVGWLPLAVGASAAFAAFALMTPYFFIDAHTAERSLTAEQAGHFADVSRGPLDNFAFYLFHAMPDSVGWPGFLLAVAGIVLAWRHRNRLALLAAAFVGTFLAALLPASLHWQRWVIPVLPFVALFAVDAVVAFATTLVARRAHEHSSRAFGIAAVIGVLAILAVPATTSAVRTFDATQPSTRSAMRSDVRREVPRRSPVAIEVKGPSLGDEGYPTYHAFDLPRNGSVADYLAHGYHYFVVNTYIALQYRLHPKRWADHFAFYQFLRGHAHLLADERPSNPGRGPHLKLYRVDDADLQRPVGRPVRGTTSRSAHDRVGHPSHEYPVGGHLFDRTRAPHAAAN